MLNIVYYSKDEAHWHLLNVSITQGSFNSESIEGICQYLHFMGHQHFMGQKHCSGYVTPWKYYQQPLWTL